MSSQEGKKEYRCPYCGKDMNSRVTKDKITCSSCSNKFWRTENLVKEET